MKSASSLKRDPELKDVTKNQLSKLLSAKSHSSQNTLRTINQMFEEAGKQCHFERERALIEWLQACVSTAVEFGLDPSAAEAKIDNEKQATTSPTRGAKQSKPVPVDDEEYEDEEYGYDQIGASDDDYCPTDEDDGVVPSKTTKPTRKSSPKTSSTTGASSPTKTSRKKKESSTDDQVVPKKKNEASFPLIKEGAGAKSLQKYIMDIESVHAVSSNDILPNGYFARAFFFPSKDSFNVSIYIIYY